MTSSPDDALEITPEAVVRAQASDDPPLLLDVRRPDEHAISSIDEAVLIPMHELPDRVDEIASWRERAVVVLCRSGQRSLDVTVWLRAQGFGDVRSMAGGINRWAVEIDPSLPRY